MADRTEVLGIRLSAEGVAEFVDASGKVVGSVRVIGTETDKTTGAQSRNTQAMRGARAEANLLAQAQRQLPMQVTDIATSLASGMPAWMVAIQQGGQLRDAYGGVLPAGRALLGLLTPVNLAIGAGAVAAVALTSAWFDGRAEATAYATAITLTGNAAGVTNNQLADMARGMDEVSGTQAQAAEVLTALVTGARVAGPQLRLVGEAVQQMNRNLGIGTEQAVEMFSRLGREPARAVADLNAKYNFLTLDVYRQIAALEKQGRIAEAGAVAQEAYASAMKQRGQEVEQRLGTLESAWRGVKQSAKEAWDAMLNLGRPDTLQQQLDQVNQQIEANARRSDRQDTYNAGSGRLMPGGDRELEQLRLKQSLLQDQMRLERRAAEQQAANARTVNAAVKEDQDRSNRKPRTGNAIESAEEEMWRRIQQWQERNQEALDKLDEQESKATASDRDRAAQLELMQRNRMAVEQQVQALQDETAAMGLSAAALNELEQARIAERIAIEETNAAIHQANGRIPEADQARDLARALRALAAARQGNFERRQVVEEEADAKRRKDLFADSIAQGIMEGYREGRSLTDIFLRELKAQFAKTVLTPRIQVLADAGNSLFEQIIGAAVGVFTGGGGTGGDSIIPGGAALPDVLRGGAATGTNYLKRDMLTLVHKGEAIVPEKFNPYAPGGSGGMGKTVQITLAPRIMIDSRSDRADIFAGIQQAMQVTKAELVEMMTRGEV